MSDTQQETATDSQPKQETPQRTCERCGKEGHNFPRCGRCKSVYYCSQDCQKKHWTEHKPDCIRPEDRPKPPDVDLIAEYVECATFEECRDFLIKHNEIITKEVSDEMYEKAFLVLKSHPPEIGTRFIRNAQIIQYLLDLRKISGGQQDINLFFHRMLDPTNPEYRKAFTEEYMTLVKRILERHKQKEKEEKEKAKQESQSNTQNQN